MAQRLYIVPEIGMGVRGDPLRAKYLDELGPINAAGQTRYGFQPIRLVGADLTSTQDASLIAHSDVYAFPFNLAPNIGGGNVQAARDALELVLIPAQWVNAQMPWMDVACIVGGMFMFMNRLKSYLPTLFLDSSAKLNAQWSSIPADIQADIVACAESFNYSTAFIAANTQIRVILETFAKAWGLEQPIFVGPMALQR